MHDIPNIKVEIRKAKKKLKLKEYQKQELIEIIYKQKS